MPKRIPAPPINTVRYAGIDRRPTYMLSQYQVFVNFEYKCPQNRAKKDKGFSRHTDVNPAEYPDLLEQLYEMAVRDAYYKAKKKCFSKSDTRKLPYFKVTGWGIISFKPVSQSKIESFVPDSDYEAKKKEWNNKQQERKKQDASYKKQHFVSNEEYDFLQKYYEFKPKDIRNMNKNERTVNKIKFSGLIDSWGSITDRKQQLKRAKQEKEKQ